MTANHLFHIIQYYAKSATSPPATAANTTTALASPLFAPLAGVGVLVLVAAELAALLAALATLEAALLALDAALDAELAMLLIALLALALADAGPEVVAEAGAVVEEESSSSPGAEVETPPVGDAGADAAGTSLASRR